MAFHLEGPWLSTTGKSRKKTKYASAEAKRRAEKNQSDWQQLLKKYEIEAETRRRNRGLTAAPLSSSYSLKVPANRSTAHIKSLPFTGDACVKAPEKVYTGDAVVGIAVQHKSCLQPVFSKEAAQDSAKMRR
jgi:hypothetical protein